MSEFAHITSIPEIVSIRDSFELTDPKWQEAEKRLRELLTDKYKDEDALCIKTDLMPSYIKPGFTPADKKKANNVSSVLLVRELSRISEFIPRAYCEYNPLYKQIIPYVVAITPDKRIFTMERIRGDDRLIGKLSIGIGGHIKSEDKEHDVILAGARREIHEEVSGVPDCAFLVFEGFLYDPSDNVGLDHIGFIFTLHLPDDSVTIKEKDTLKGYFTTVSELRQKADRLENWSKIVLEALFNG